MSTRVRRRRRSRGARATWRRLRRRWERRPGVVVAGAAGGLLVVVVVWCAWVGWSTARDLREAERQAEIMRAALVRADTDGARTALEAFTDAASGAESSSDGPTWWLLERIPFLGDDLEGIAVVSSVLADVGREGLPPVLDAADDVTAQAFQPKDHVFPVDRVRRLEEPTRSSQAAFDAAGARLAAVDSTGFVGPIRGRFDDLRALVDDAGSTLGSVYRASRLMPRLLGADKPRFYLLVLQNNAEARSTGGIPGSLSLLRAADGRVDIVEQADMAELEGTSAPVLPLDPEETELFGPKLGSVGVNATLTPDVPRVAELVRARWERSGRPALDGVFLVDPVAVSYLLRGVGSVPVPGAAPVTASSVVADVENEVYLRTASADQQSAYQNAVAKAVFNAFADGQGDPASAIRGLVSGVSEGRVRMHFFDDAAQAEVAGTAIAGEFVGRDDPRPQVGVYVNDGGPTKMQYYLRSRTQLVARSCVDDVQVLAGSVTLTNAAPPSPDLLPDTVTGEFFPGNRTDPGQQLLVVYVSSPAGGSLEELRIDGQGDGAPSTKPYAGTQVATVGLLLDPGETRTLDFVARSAPGQTGGAVLALSPGATAGSGADAVRSACDVR